MLVYLKVISTVVQVSDESAYLGREFKAYLGGLSGIEPKFSIRNISLRKYGKLSKLSKCNAVKPVFNGAPIQPSLSTETLNYGFRPGTLQGFLKLNDFIDKPTQRHLASELKSSRLQRVFWRRENGHLISASR